MKTVKFSYTTLNSWSKGYQEDAVSQYLGKGIPETPAIKLGSVMHETWERKIKKTREIPEELGGGKVSEKAIVEEFMGCTIPLSDDYQIYLIGKFDLVDQGVIQDWKCGMSEPSTHLNGFQLGYYQTILKANQTNVSVGRIVCYNPYERTHKVGIKFLNEETLADALNHIITYGGEMITYLETQKLLKDYDPNWREKPASEKQLSYLRSLGATKEQLEKVTAGSASKLIDELK